MAHPEGHFAHTFTLPSSPHTVFERASFASMGASDQSHKTLRDKLADAWRTATTAFFHGVNKDVHEVCGDVL